MSGAEKARRTLLGVEIPRDELALQIARGCIGLIPPAGTNASKVLDDMDRMATLDPAMPRMGQGFRRAADLAVLYFHERINAARQPS